MYLEPLGETKKKHTLDYDGQICEGVYLIIIKVQGAQAIAAIKTKISKSLIQCKSKLPGTTGLTVTAQPRVYQLSSYVNPLSPVSD